MLTVVQVAEKHSTQGANVTALTTDPIATTSGHMLIVATHAYSPDNVAIPPDTSITDSGGHTWTLLYGQTAGGIGNPVTRVWKVATITGSASHTVTIDRNQSSGSMGIIVVVLEVSGALADVDSAVSTTRDFSHTSLGVAVTADAALLIGIGGPGGGASTFDAPSTTNQAEAAYTEVVDVIGVPAGSPTDAGHRPGILIATRSVAVPGTYDFTWTTDTIIHCTSGLLALAAAAEEPPPEETSSESGSASEIAAGGGGIELAITQTQRELAAQTLHPASECLAKMGTRLHDDGALWSTDELMDWYNDGYRELLALSGALRRFRAFPLPPRRAMGITQEWEDRHAGGTVGKVTLATASGFYQALGRWEIEQAVA